MVNLHRISIIPPVINTSCVWASELDELRDLYNSPFTGAVTTRTATLTGFSEDSSHQVAFVKDTLAALNSYGYSPHPLTVYLEWVESIIRSDPSSSKPFIISITSSSPMELSTMLDAIQALRTRINDSVGPRSRIAIEYNTSCPNIKGSTPPAYKFPELFPVLEVLANCFKKDGTLTIGLKLAPYVYATQFEDVIRTVASLMPLEADVLLARNPIAFLTSTNTLGNSLLFGDQTTSPHEFAVPTALGGLSGEPIHALSLGNVWTLTKLLAGHSNRSLRDIKLIGVGGVTSSEAAERMRKAGAHVVGCATLLGREGVRGFKNLSSIHGA